VTEEKHRSQIREWCFVTLLRRRVRVLEYVPDDPAEFLVCRTSRQPQANTLTCGFWPVRILETY
jgi:hypothetical protein